MSENEQQMDLLALACRAADKAREHSLSGFRTGMAYDDKSSGMTDIDPVTDADRRSEAAIKEVLAAAGAGIGFIGEETAAGATSCEDGSTWVVDPIDGTRAYICGIPLWSTLIALCECGSPVFGVVDFPALGERFIGEEGGARVLRQGGTHALRARQGVPLSAAILCCTTPDMFMAGQQRHAFESLRTQAAMTRFGTDAYAYAMLAAGHVDAVLEADLAPWDVAAVAALVRGAGGVMTDWSGQAALSSGTVVAAGSRELHDELLMGLAALM